MITNHDLFEGNTADCTHEFMFLQYQSGFVRSESGVGLSLQQC